METFNLGSFELESQSEHHERADAAANRRLILETAARLFEQHGVANVTMADIAAEAGVGKGTLYRRFDNKSELALALLDNQMRDFQNEVLAQLRAYAQQGQPYLAQLDYFLDALVHFTDLHLPFLCAVQSTGLELEGRELSRPYHWQHQTISGLLLRAVESGELAPSRDIVYTADALLAPLRADIFRFQREVRGFSLERMSSGLRSMITSQ
jgi:AcrR family transcriptional regulator